MSRVLMAFMDNPALRPSYNAGSYTQDGTFTGPDGQGAAVGSYEAGKAAIQRGDAPDPVRERFIKAWGDPGKLTFDMGVPEATTTPQATPIERVETQPQMQTMQPATDRSVPPEAAMSPVRARPTAATAQPPSATDDAAADAEITSLLAPAMGLPLPARAAPQPGPPQIADAKTLRLTGPKDGPDAVSVDAPTPPKSPPGGANASAKVNGSNAGSAAMDGIGMPPPTTDPKGNAVQPPATIDAPKPTTATASPKQLPGPDMKAPRLSAPDTTMSDVTVQQGIRSIQEAITSGDVRTANELLAGMRNALTPEQIDQVRGLIEDASSRGKLPPSDVVGDILRGVRSGVARR
jgi:hypothetical protein